MELEGVPPQCAAQPLRPFDHKGRMVACIFESELVDFRGMLDTVEIDMPEGHDKILIGLHDRKRRAGNLPGKAEAAENATSERRLARTEIAEQSHHVPRTKPGAERRSE